MSPPAEIAFIGPGPRVDGFRGDAPHSRVIEAGRTNTGVTGSVLLQSPVAGWPDQRRDPASN